MFELTERPGPARFCGRNIASGCDGRTQPGPQGRPGFICVPGSESYHPATDRPLAGPSSPRRRRRMGHPPHAPRHHLDHARAGLEYEIRNGEIALRGSPGGPVGGPRWTETAPWTDHTANPLSSDSSSAALITRLNGTDDGSLSHLGFPGYHRGLARQAGLSYSKGKTRRLIGTGRPAPVQSPRKRWQGLQNGPWQGWRLLNWDGRDGAGGLRGVAGGKPSFDNLTTPERPQIGDQSG